MNLIWLLVVLCVVGPIAAAVAHRIKEGPAAPAGSGDEAGREEIRELREEVRRLDRELDRLAEKQGFLEELLEERPALGSGDEERKTAS